MGDEDAPALHLGEVSSINHERAFSKIRCPGAGYDMDIYVHQSVADPSLWAIGDTVACSVELGVKGNPKALAPVWKLEGRVGQASTPELGQYVGEVQGVNEQGNAFVECPEVVEDYGRQAFIHCAVLSRCHLVPGDMIGFHVHANAQGSPQVAAPCWLDCSHVNPARRKVSEPAPQDFQLKPKPKPLATAPADSKSKQTSNLARPAVAMELPPAKVAKLMPQRMTSYFFGRVSKVNPTVGYSSIECPDSGYNCDVNVKSLVAPPTVSINVDDIVAFRLHEDSGKPQAIAPLWRLAGDDDCQTVPPLGTYVGRLTRKSKEGHGFLESEAVREACSLDTYVHNSAMLKCKLELGDTLLFDVSLNDRGQPQMQAPCWKCCSSENIPSTSEVFNPDEAVSQTKAPVSKTAAPRAGSETNSNPSGKFEGRMPSYRDRYYVGTIKTVLLEKNFSYVFCPDTGYEQDVFVHHETADPALFEVGEHVAFPLHISSRGLPQASSPLWKLAGFVKPDAKVQFASWIGQVKDFNESGNSHVDCDELVNEYGKEAFVHQSVIEQCQLVPGEMIAFNVHVNTRGLPQASAPLWRLCSDPNRAPSPGPVLQHTRQDQRQDKAQGKGKRKHGQDHSDKGGKGSGKGTGTLEDYEGLYAVGWVRKVDTTRTCSYVDVPDSGLERDVFVPFSVGYDLHEEDTVYFMMHHNTHGKIQASNRDVLWKLVGRSPSGNVAEIGTYIGKVKAINANGGAHVMCPDLKQVHPTEAYLDKQVVDEADLQEGQTILFDVHWNKMGQPKVTSPLWKNASPYEPESVQWDSVDWERERAPKRKLEHVESRPQEKTSTWGPHKIGFVKSVVLDKGFSMVDVPQSGYEHDVWVGKTSADPELLSEGDTVFFRIHISSRGLPQAAAPVWKLVGTMPPQGNVSLVGSYKGKVQVANGDGSANVACPEIDAEFANDALVERETLEETGIQPGDTIFFDVNGTSLEGMPLVSSPMWKSCSHERFAPLGDSAKIREALHETNASMAVLPSIDSSVQEEVNAHAGGGINMLEDEEAPPPAHAMSFSSTAGGNHHVQHSQPLQPEPPQDPRTLKSPRSGQWEHPPPPPPASAAATPMTAAQTVPAVPAPAAVPAPKVPSPPRDPRHSKTKTESLPLLPPISAPPAAATNLGAGNVADDSPLKEGDLAEIHSLTSEAGKTLNNLRVTVVKVLDSGRMQVHFHPEANRPQDVRLKAANLRRPIAPL